jgi:hypothetical protein
MIVSRHELTIIFTAGKKKIRNNTLLAVSVVTVKVFVHHYHILKIIVKVWVHDDKLMP